MRTLLVRGWALHLIALASALLFAPTIAAASVPSDTLRARPPAPTAIDVALVTAVIPGYLSARGLPPITGSLIITDTGLVFRTSAGAVLGSYPLVGPVRRRGSRDHRATTVALAYVANEGKHSSYLFRLDGGVFETASPGPLQELAQHPAWLDRVRSEEWSTDRPLVDPADTDAAVQLAAAISSGAYADSLYTLFGRPARCAGLVGKGGRDRGRLGEYIASRDSLALDPGRITSEAQLRHAFTHELAHRWQRRSVPELRALWAGVEPVHDSRRYGYASVGEQQAEAVAFAIHFLQTTGAGIGSVAAGLELLDHYELLMPGTRVLTRYFALQPIYRDHPLRIALASRAASLQ
ncbi:MAG: hypothetical protein H0W67_05860 [Gemmatimonadales bacterium]|nr:hypothetical protein [Gemmatimonadales bacterium]